MSEEPRKPLSAQQVRAAAAVGRGHSCEDAGRAVGVSKRTIVRWMERDDMREAVARAREGALDALPTARRAGGGAERRAPSGKPDWPSRIRAAQLLMKEEPPPDAPEAPRETRIYVPPDKDEEDDGAPRPSPVTEPEYRA